MQLPSLKRLRQMPHTWRIVFGHGKPNLCLAPVAKTGFFLCRANRGSREYRGTSLEQLRRWINFVIAVEEPASPEGDGKE